MKASELRIGNFISSCFPISVVIGIDDEGVIDTAYYEHGKGVDYTSEWHSNEGSINPIPLTKEWLDMLDWKNRKDKDIAVSFGLTSGTIHFVAGNYYTECYSVHHLQNLYHALTGEELTIN